MHRVDAFCCCRCCTFPCLSVFDKKTGESCKNRSTAEKLEGTSRGVDADPVLFPPPSLPRCCSTHVADAQPRVTKHWKQCTCTSIVQLLHPHIYMLKIRDYTIFQLHDIIFCYCQLLLYLWRIKVHIHQQSHMCDTVLIWKPLPTEILITMTVQWRVLSHHINQIVNKPEHCLHYVLPAAREQSVTDRLRSANKLPRIFAKTTHTPV